MTFLADAPSAPGRHAWRQHLQGQAEFHGWRCYLLGADWEPDLLLVRRPRLLWVFAEGPRGRLSALRLRAFAELRACGQEVQIARPSDAEKLARVLR